MYRRFDIDVTATEVTEVEKGYDFKYDYCSYKTQINMRIHRSRCKYGYDTTEQYYNCTSWRTLLGCSDRK